MRQPGEAIGTAVIEELRQRLSGHGEIRSRVSRRRSTKDGPDPLSHVRVGVHLQAVLFLYAQACRFRESMCDLVRVNLARDLESRHAIL